MRQGLTARFHRIEACEQLARCCRQTADGPAEGASGAAEHAGWLWLASRGRAWGARARTGRQARAASPRLPVCQAWTLPDWPVLHSQPPQPQGPRSGGCALGEALQGARAAAPGLSPAATGQAAGEKPLAARLQAGCSLGPGSHRPVLRRWPECLAELLLGLEAVRLALGPFLGAAAGERCPGCGHPVKPASEGGSGSEGKAGCAAYPWLVVPAGCWQGQVRHDLAKVGLGGLAALRPGGVGRCPSLTRRSLSSALRRWPQCCCSSQLMENRGPRRQRQGPRSHLWAPAGLPERHWEGRRRGHGCVRACDPAVCCGAAEELRRLQGWVSSPVQLLNWQQGQRCRACLEWTGAPSQGSEGSPCRLPACSRSSGKQQGLASCRPAAHILLAVYGGVGRHATGVQRVIPGPL